MCTYNINICKPLCKLPCIEQQIRSLKVKIYLKSEPGVVKVKKNTTVQVQKSHNNLYYFHSTTPRLESSELL